MSHERDGEAFRGEEECTEEPTVAPWDNTADGAGNNRGPYGEAEERDDVPRKEEDEADVGIDGGAGTNNVVASVVVVKHGEG